MKKQISDKIVGRPIRLNKQNLSIKEKKDYAEVIFLGDLHFGSPQFDEQRFLNMVNYCRENNIYVFLMGDLIEMATRRSVGAGVYEQSRTGQSQYEIMCDWLRPLADKKLILGTLTGNHEERVYIETGISIGKAFARELRIPFLGHACWSQFKVNGQTYTIYSLHGRSGARFDGTALLAIERISTSFFADLVVIGHCHKLITSSVIIQKVYNNRVIEHKKHLLITGSYLGYDGGYAQMIGLPISKLGSPKVKFYSSRHDLHISW